MFSPSNGGWLVTSSKSTAPSDPIRFTCCLFGRHVGRRADGTPGLREFRAGVQTFGETKIRDLRIAIHINQNVVWLYVAVDHFLRMSVFERFGQIDDQVQRAADGNHPLDDELAERFPINEIHGVIVPTLELADVVDGHDVRVS